MKILNLFFKLLLSALMILGVSSCEKKPDDTSINKEKISGFVQKGPYLIGTSLNLSELNSDLGQTGKIFTTDISNNQGAFEISNIELSSSYVEITAGGFYFNEVRGKNSTAQLTLSAVSDILDKSSLNVNVLSHLEKDRLFHLVSSGASFADAKNQAQKEILKVFTLEKGDIANSELLNIAEAGDDNAILLAVSVILQGHLSVADMSELIGKLNSDLREDGVLDNPSIGTSLINNARLANLEDVRTNLEERYAELDVDASIPGFEKYVQQFIDSSGYEFSHFPVYSRTSVYGTNVLYLDTDTFYTDQELSMAAELPTGTSLKIVLSEGLWWYRVMPGGPKNWDISQYNSGIQSQEFIASHPDESSDLSIEFDVPHGGSHKFKVEYYENMAESPTRTRDIVVVDQIIPGSGYDLTYPEKGSYGQNILAMAGETLSLDKGAKYSLAVQFPEWDEDSASCYLNFEEQGFFATNPAEMNLWTVQQDSSSLLILAAGKDIQADMSIVFNKSGMGWFYKMDSSKILLIK